MIQNSESIEYKNIKKNLLLHSNYQLIKISGDDAGNFLQAQLTCNVNNINEQPSLGAICNIQGRVECVFKIYKLNNIFYMIIIKELLAQTIENLSNYILRSKVILQAIDQPTIKSINQQELDLSWEKQEILQKIPEIYLTTTGKFLPHNIGLINLGAVNLNKGCFKGKAIINRMECLSKIKKELKILSLPNINRILTPGDKLNHPDVTVVRSVILNNNQQLALIETPIALKEHELI